MYLKSPFPFQGQKRFYAQKLRDFDFGKLINDKTIIVDVFGGSGLMSHVFASKYPKNKVIYNDFDNFYEVLKKDSKIVKVINECIDKIGKSVDFSKYDKQEKLSVEDRNKIKNIVDTALKQNENVKNIKYIIKFFASYLGFGGQQHLNSDLYNKWTGKKLNHPEGYILPNMEITHEDFKVLLNKFKSNKNVFYIFDPPYLFTDKSSYNADKKLNFWSLTDSFYMLDFIFDYVNKCILFESEKSGLLTVLEFTNNKHKIFNVDEIVEVGYTSINSSHIKRANDDANELQHVGYKDHCILLTRI